MDMGLNVLSGKWNLKILWVIYRRQVIRFNDLQREVAGISTKVLSAQLRELEQKGIITKTIYPEVPPRVEYSLTAIGRKLESVMEALCTWGKNYQRSQLSWLGSKYVNRVEDMLCWVLNKSDFNQGYGAVEIDFYLSKIHLI